MRIAIFGSSQWTEYAAQFSSSWRKRFSRDELVFHQVESSGGMVLPSHLKIDPETDLLLVIQEELTDFPGTQDLANLVAARTRRLGIQPVVVFATSTPLSKRQIQELGFAGSYFREDHPQRQAEDWGRILAQTWHID